MCLWQKYLAVSLLAFLFNSSTKMFLKSEFLILFSFHTVPGGSWSSSFPQILVSWGWSPDVLLWLWLFSWAPSYILDCSLLWHKGVFTKSNTCIYRFDRYTLGIYLILWQALGVQCQLKWIRFLSIEAYILLSKDELDWSGWIGVVWIWKAFWAENRDKSEYRLCSRRERSRVVLAERRG